ncbi:MAG: dienelactone hydrolase family protein [Campylobacterales bacterium]|nr:dienelactone hydrolase family protein [Campylobacterales bacterium]
MLRIIFTIGLFSQLIIAGIGFKEETFINHKLNRTLITKVWYPSSDNNNQIFGENIAFKGFNGRLNGTIKRGKYPLVILFHGTSGNWKNQSWLASKLVENGYMVIGANHPDYTSEQATPSKVIKMWNQPKDGSFLIDSILASKYSKFIDKKKIYAVGYSLGGYTSLALGGVKLNMKKYKDFCQNNFDRSCGYFQKTFSKFDKNYYKSSSQSLKDPRIKASIAIVPGFIPMMTKESLKNIKIPSLVIGGELDKNVPVQTQIKPQIKNFSKKITYVEIEDASHFSFVQVCKKGATEVLAKEGASFVCEDGKNKSREELHSQLLQTIKKFLNRINK